MTWYRNSDARRQTFALAVCGSVYMVVGLLLTAGCQQGVSSSTPALAAPAQPENATATQSPPATQTKTPNQTTAAPAPPASTRPAAPADDKVRNVTFDSIKFDMKKTEPFKRTMLTEKINKLFGKRIRIRGYIRPGIQQTGITRFALVRDNQECCFGPGASLYDCVLVEMQTGRSADFTTRPVTVEGRIRLEEYVLDGTTFAIYRLVGEKVE